MNEIVEKRNEHLQEIAAYHFKPSEDDIELAKPVHRSNPIRP